MNRLGRPLPRAPCWGQSRCPAATAARRGGSPVGRPVFGSISGFFDWIFGKSEEEKQKQRVQQSWAPGVTSMAAGVLWRLKQERDGRSWKTYHGAQERKSKLWQKRLAVIEEEMIRSDEEFQRKHARRGLFQPLRWLGRLLGGRQTGGWKEFVRAEEEAHKPVKGESHLDMSASKWTAEMLGQYVPSLSMRWWGRKQDEGGAVPLTELAACFREGPVGIKRGKKMAVNEELSPMAKDVHTRIHEALSVSGLVELKELQGGNEATSRLAIDAALMPLCRHLGLQMSVEKSFASADVVTGRADYSIARGQEVLAVVEAKKAADPSKMENASMQVLIQAISIAGSRSPAASGRSMLALVTDGWHWVTFSVERHGIVLLLWPGASNASVLDLAADGAVEMLVAALESYLSE